MIEQICTTESLVETCVYNGSFFEFFVFLGMFLSALFLSSLAPKERKKVQGGFTRARASGRKENAVTTGRNKREY